MKLSRRIASARTGDTHAGHPQVRALVRYYDLDQGFIDEMNRRSGGTHLAGRYYFWDDLRAAAVSASRDDVVAFLDAYNPGTAAEYEKSVRLRLTGGLQ